MVESAVTHLRSAGAEKFVFLAYGKDLSPAAPCASESFSRGLSLLGAANQMRFVWWASRFERFYLLGADVMDGHYSDARTQLRLNCSMLADLAGAQTAILGFSFNDRPTRGVTKALFRLPKSIRLCARDPISYGRLKKFLPADKTVDLVADLAFLLKPSSLAETEPKLESWMESERALGRWLMGINANQMHALRAPEQKEEFLARAYASTMARVAQDHLVSFILIGHDRRPNKNGMNDASVHALIADSLPSSVREHVYLLPGDVSAAGIKAICGKLDFVLTGRMHLAIASFGSGTPAACIDYQGKVQGLFHHLNLTGMTIGNTEALEEGGLQNFLLPLIQNRSSIRQQVRENVPRVRQLALKNFK